VQQAFEQNKPTIIEIVEGEIVESELIKGAEKE